MIRVHPLVKSQYDNKTSSLRSYTIQQRTRYRHALQAKNNSFHKLHPKDWQ